MQIQELLSGKLNNKIFPFMWVHGESEAVYRDTIRAIDEANIKAFCVEARPHPEFCKDQWWTDMAIILDEAEKRGMKVWILDDKHFPTGYAAGAAETAPPELRRRSVLYQEIAVNGPVSLDLKTAFVREKSTLQQMTDFSNDNQKAENIFDDDTFLAAAAVPLGVSFFGMNNRKPIPLDAYIRDGVLNWTPEEGAWKIALCWLSGNAGVHRNYINMTDPRSCRIQIDAVYETHYAHFKDKFGSVIAGFFSDEPELGNGAMFKMYNTLGTDQDLPWSLPIERAMREKLGDDFSALLPLLWNNDCETALTAKVRYTYMDCVTRLVQKSFSEQIGDWCRAHGVEYIGHVIEDQNQHARTGTSLGHFFRGLRGQSMSGIDVIGGQIYPQGEDVRRKTIWGDPGDSEFFHYALAKLGSSLGELTPHMQSRTMIELFGAYGWSEGVQLEKYLADHCLVRGINHFVPHAFSCKAYPDPDCPPHFYAHGHDPLYRHFGKLMQYTNRVSSLLENGRTQAPAAILYHGEAEWCGDYMLMQKPARVLADRQIDFRFIPCDVFEEPDFYNTELSDTLRINGHTHNILFVPYAQFLPLTTLNGLAALAEHGCPVVFLDNLPDGAATGEPLPEALRHCPTVNLLDLQDYVTGQGLETVALSPKSHRIRALHSKGEEETVMLVNESAAVYDGAVQLPWTDETYVYNAWDNRVEQIGGENGTVSVHIRPSESCILVRGKAENAATPVHALQTDCTAALDHFRVSNCRSIDYPQFRTVGELHLPQSFDHIEPKFSGFIAYETEFNLSGCTCAVLEITDAREGVEIFVNGESTGIQILPPYAFEITSLVKPGKNTLRIEVATTLERENMDRPMGWSAPAAPPAPTGITGKVLLHYTK
ncbi:MAG: hypothetical protein IJF56_04595 [Clostridia bacterium]|nr:hypothetical protein [Clostridia bacterium]